jgi:hypothetical protein
MTDGCSVFLVSAYATAKFLIHILTGQTSSMYRCLRSPISSTLDCLRWGAVLSQVASMVAYTALGYLLNRKVAYNK